MFLHCRLVFIQLHLLPQRWGEKKKRKRDLYDWTLCLEFLFAMYVCRVKNGFACPITQIPNRCLIGKIKSAKARINLNKMLKSTTYLLIKSTTLVAVSAPVDDDPRPPTVV